MSTEEEDGGVIHLIGDGVAGAGGSVAGARSVWVAVKMTGGKFGGMTKCIFSSL